MFMFPGRGKPDEKILIDICKYNSADSLFEQIIMIVKVGRRSSSATLLITPIPGKTKSN